MCEFRDFILKCRGKRQVIHKIHEKKLKMFFESQEKRGELFRLVDLQRSFWFHFLPTRNCWLIRFCELQESYNARRGFHMNGGFQHQRQVLEAFSSLQHERNTVLKRFSSLKNKKTQL